MKKISIAIAALLLALSSTGLYAQGKFGADSAECIKYLSFYREYFKQKSYNEAIPNWRKAFSLCPPTANQNMLVDGATLLRKLISSNSKNPVYKAKLVDSLMLVHDLRIEYYPKYAVTARNNKGLDMANYLKDDAERLFNGYNEIIEANREQTKPQILLFDLDAAIELFKLGSVDEETIINIYERNMEYLALSPEKTEADADIKSKIKTDMENLFVSSKVADCDKLIELYTPRFEANPQDVELAGKIVRFMATADDCMNNNLFISAATLMHQSAPSASSAYMLYRLNSSNGNVDLALKYIEEAIASEDSDAATDAEYYYELAVYCYKSGRALKAEQAARNVIPNAASGELKGKAYMLLGSIWGNVRCEGNDIQKRAPYWVAVDFLEKAKAADPSLAADANKQIAQFKQYYPQTADAFMFDILDGQSYEVSCNGFRATTTVRTQK